MGRNSGGVNSVPTNRSATERGYTEKMQENIARYEQFLKNSGIDAILLYRADGTLIEGYEKRSEYKDWIDKDNILSFVRPKREKPLSIREMYDGIDNDVKEIRAVTNEGVFSFKRPKKGWGKLSNFSLELEYVKAEAEVNQNKAIKKGSFAYHKAINTLLAKRYGWNFTSKRTKK